MYPLSAARISLVYESSLCGAFLRDENTSRNRYGPIYSSTTADMFVTPVAGNKRFNCRLISRVMLDTARLKFGPPFVRTGAPRCIREIYTRPRGSAAAATAVAATDRFVHVRGPKPILPIPRQWVQLGPVDIINRNQRARYREKKNEPRVKDTREDKRERGGEKKIHYVNSERKRKGKKERERERDSPRKKRIYRRSVRTEVDAMKSVIAEVRGRL